MNPVNEVTTAAKSAFTLKNMLYVLLSVMGLFLIFNLFGLTAYLVTPKDAFADLAKRRGWIKTASVVMVFATCAAATATNALML